MPEFNQTELLAAWMEGTLTPQQRQQFETLCSENAEFSRQVEMANQANMLAQDYRPMSPPQWNKEATFGFESSPKWWQWQGLPAFSSALSVVAIVLVLTGFEAKVENGRVSFGFQSGQPDVEQIVAQRIDAFKQEQQVAMTTFATSLREQQLNASTQLTQYLLTSSRQERKEDFGELIKFINEQRNDDQIYYARQLNQLENAIYNNAPGQSWKPSGNAAQDLNE